MISMTTIYTDLSALTDAELETLQLAVNGEVAIRIQNERLAQRITKAVTDAQELGFRDEEIAQIIDESQTQARTARREHSPKLIKDSPPDPEKFGPPAPKAPKPSTPLKLK